MGGDRERRRETERQRQREREGDPETDRQTEITKEDKGASQSTFSHPVTNCQQHDLGKHTFQHTPCHENHTLPLEFNSEVFSPKSCTYEG